MNMEETMIYIHEKHEQQKRKYTGMPYTTHPMSVYAILLTITDDENVLKAGLLHDVIEDTPTSYTEIKKLFGKRVADIVKEVTKDKNGKFNIKTKEGLMVKLADTLHNVSDCPNKAYISKKKQWLNEILDKEEKSLKDALSLSGELGLRGLNDEKQNK